jgi:Zn-dependent M16 (insulinase) family peptidase
MNYIFLILGSNKTIF